MNRNVPGALILVILIELGLTFIEARALEDDAWAGSNRPAEYHEDPYDRNDLLEFALLGDDEIPFSRLDHLRSKLNGLRTPIKKSLDLINRWRPLAGPIPVDTRSRPEYSNDIVSAVQRDSAPHRPLRFG